MQRADTIVQQRIRDERKAERAKLRQQAITDPVVLKRRRDSRNKKRRERYDAKKKAERAAARELRRIEIEAAKVAKAQRRAEWEAKRLARQAKKNAPKPLPKPTREYIQGFEDGKRFAMQDRLAVRPSNFPEEVSI
jgi:hypothetical protein